MNFYFLDLYSMIAVKQEKFLDEIIDIDDSKVVNSQQ
jgi:hypothetical protein